MTDKKIRFDGWVVDLDLGDLERAGTRTRLQEQPLQVLRELISCPGEMVTREQLIARLWPKGVVDFDTGLNTAIRKLRGALGDTADTPRYIETLPRRGYRFIAELEAPSQAFPDAILQPSTSVADVSSGSNAADDQIDSGLPGKASQSSLGTTGRTLLMRRSTWVVSGILVAIFIGAGQFLARGERQPRNPLLNAHFSRLSDMTGLAQSATISRDGKLAAFVSDHDGQNDVWITEVGSGQYRNLTKGKAKELVNPAIRTLGFSPDSSLVTVWQRGAFGAPSSDINIASIPSNGGEMRQFLAGAAEAVWSSDGKQILYHTSAPGDPMFIRDPSQMERRIYTAQAPTHCHFPTWSPDDAFIYMVCGVPQAGWDIWRIHADGSNPERITSHKTLVSHLVALDSKTFAYLAADADETRGLYVIDINQREPHRVSSGLERYSSLAASADGKRLVATVVHPRSSLWRISINQGPAAPSAPAVRITADQSASPRVGESSLLYLSTRGGRQGIWQLSGDGSRELWSHPQQSVISAPAWAVDGKHIAFTASDGATRMLYVIKSDGSEAHVLLASRTLRGNPAWSPDGSSVMCAVAEDGTPHLLAVHLDGTAPAVMVPEYSLDPAWSRDGTFVVYSGADVGTTFPLRAIASDGKAYALPAPILTRGARRVVFSRDGQAIVVLRGEIGHKNFWSIGLKNGVEQQLTELPPDFDVRDFDISQDGAEIVFDRAEDNSEIALIDRAS